MRGDHFVADEYSNHYSLLRTIEDSLGLLPLTNNDRFAPTNERILAVGRQGPHRRHNRDSGATYDLACEQHTR